MSKRKREDEELCKYLQNEDGLELELCKLDTLLREKLSSSSHSLLIQITLKITNIHMSCLDVYVELLQLIHFIVSK